MEELVVKILNKENPSDKDLAKFREIFLKKLKKYKYNTIRN